MTIFNRLGAIAGLDLSKVRTNAMRRHGWTEGRAAEAEADYRRFLYLLARDPMQTIVPWTVDLDKFWHEHILDTSQYAQDCALVFGQFIHHDPNIRLTPEAEARAKLETSQLFQLEFIDRKRADYPGWLLPSAAAVAAIGMLQPAAAAPSRDEEENRRQQANTPVGSSNSGSSPGTGGGCASAPAKSAPSSPAAEGSGSSGASCSSGGASCGAAGCGGGG